MNRKEPVIALGVFILFLGLISGCGEEESNPTWTPEAEELKPLFMTLYGNPPRWDVNQDGIVDIFDLVLIGKHFGEKYEVKEAPFSDLLQESEEKYLNGDKDGAITSLRKAILLLEKEVLPPPNIILVKESLNETQDFLGNFKLLGELKNIGGRPAIFVKISLTLKDKNGKVMGTAFSYVNGSVFKQDSIETDTCLQPDETGSFELITTTQKENVAEWDYKISWEEVE